MRMEKFLLACSPGTEGGACSEERSYRRRGCRLRCGRGVVDRGTTAENGIGAPRPLRDARLWWRTARPRRRPCVMLAGGGGAPRRRCRRRREVVGEIHQRILEGAAAHRPGDMRGERNENMKL